MCCSTHKLRDEEDYQHQLMLSSNEDQRLRCQCTYGSACMRKATAEDFICDWCRDLDGPACLLEVVFPGEYKWNERPGHDAECHRLETKAIVGSYVGGWSDRYRAEWSEAASAWMMKP